MKDSRSGCCFGSSSLLPLADGQPWLASAMRNLSSGFSVAATDITANSSKSRRQIEHERALWWATEKKDLYLIFFFFLVLFVWFWMCRFSELGRGENWKQTHPPWRASLSTKSMRVQRMRRHTTTDPQCNAEGDKHSEARDESEN